MRKVCYLATSNNPPADDAGQLLLNFTASLKLQRVAKWYYSWARKKIEALQEENKTLREESDYWKKMATTDSLTGLFNRRYVESALAQNNDNQTKVGTQILYIDLKKFKHINDTYGHDIGDEALRRTADFLKSKIRKTDVVGRLGGDEFIVILDGADTQSAMEKIRDIRVGFQGLGFSFVDAMTKQEVYVPIRGTVGHYEIEAADMSPEQILKEGDKRMYDAKNEPAPKF